MSHAKRISQPFKAYLCEIVASIFLANPYENQWQVSVSVKSARLQIQKSHQVAQTYVALLFQVNLSTTKALTLKRAPIELSVNLLPPVTLWFFVKLDQTFEARVETLSCEERVVLWFSHFHDFSDFLRGFSCHQLFELFLFSWISIVLKPNFRVSEILIQLYLVTETLNQTLELCIFDLIGIGWVHEFLFPLFNSLICFLF